MTAPAGWDRHVAERVAKPNGRFWRSQKEWPPKAHTERTVDGPVVVVLRTHDRERARRMAEVRWQAFYPDLPLPVGELEWRRYDPQSWARYRGESGAGFAILPCTADEARSFPVVVFRASVHGASS